MANTVSTCQVMRLYDYDLAANIGVEMAETIEHRHCSCRHGMLATSCPMNA